jgi:sialate O-acetylesterase
MVLQRDIELPVFGFSRPGDSVRVKLLDQTRDAIADQTGKWLVRFDALHAGGPIEISVTGHEAEREKTVTLANVLVGEVWVCSGQSNMELMVKQCSNADQEIKSANYPRIRINSGSALFVKASGRDWVECSPQVIANCSAVGYFFGRDLHKDLDVPIGLVVRAVGGTVIKQWAPKSGEWVENDPDLKPLNEEWKRSVETYATKKKAYSTWQATTRQSTTRPALAAAPPVPFDPQRWGGMYDGQIAPLLPFAIRGVIWYQGETDARTGREDDQRSTLPRMIHAWRKAWGQGDFPFLLVQLANDWGGSGVTKAPELPAFPPENQHWPWVREAQAIACKLLPNTAMACTIDLGGKIHFPGKQDVARRLAHVAEAQVYKLPVIATGPSYAAMRTEDNAIRLSFTGASHGLTTHDSGPVQGFAIAGPDHKFFWAEGTIEGDTVVVRSPRVTHPMAVRYDWLNDPHGNLYNADGLPTAPFRTDDWPRIAELRPASVVRGPVDSMKNTVPIAKDSQ